MYAGEGSDVPWLQRWLIRPRLRIPWLWGYLTKIPCRGRPASTNSWTEGWDGWCPGWIPPT